MTHTNSVLSLFSPFIETRKTKKKQKKKIKFTATWWFGNEK